MQASTALDGAQLDDFLAHADRLVQFRTDAAQVALQLHHLKRVLGSGGLVRLLKRG